ncbi:MAG: RsmF rRNA methyltransferase first C-terminal domain-containing protein [Lachnospiraceae bacterium]|nr:RsmF rRNA methyltransferase first C-terminal domain-containing protein [Lachnospiraceae bacterium]
MLPVEYVKRMKDLLGDEYEAYEKSLEGPMIKALRLNPLKGEEAQLLDLCRESFGDVFERVPWEGLGYYYPSDDRVRPGISPLHEAGAYYIQEPSAMKPVTLLDIKPGERVLDLCAAPGGKSSQIAGYLKGRGLLVCNEPVSKRASILSLNIERMGVPNALVLNEMPASLEEVFAGFFDKILVDAPCSGEGMFRKNEEEALREWSPENVAMCAARQKEIMKSACRMLRPGGLMAYSTCTFSRQEDEDLIESVLHSHPDLTLVSMEKLYPHRVRGEGHFMALLKKEGEGGPIRPSLPGPGKIKGKEAFISAFNDFADNALSESGRAMVSCMDRFVFFGDNLYMVPEGAPSLKGLKVERAGLHLGYFKKDGRGNVRFEPSHSMALAFKPSMTADMVDITLQEAASYIGGLTLDVSGRAGSMKGWVLVCVRGVSLGWGKLVNGTVKNHYPKGLRRMN